MGKIKIVESIIVPKITIEINYVGSNSLMGSLYEDLVNKDLVKHIGVLCPDEIVFEIKRAHPELDIYKELRDVSVLFKIPSNKIKLYLRP